MTKEKYRKKKETILVALFRQLSIFLNFYYTQGSVLESEKDIKYIKKKKDLKVFTIQQEKNKMNK